MRRKSSGPLQINHFGEDQEKKVPMTIDMERDRWAKGSVGEKFKKQLREGELKANLS